MKSQNLSFSADFTGYSESDRRNCESFQAVARTLQPFIPSSRDLANATFAVLTAEVDYKQQYCRIYFCEVCGALYHADYSANSDPNHNYHRQCQPNGSIARHG